MAALSTVFARPVAGGGLPPRRGARPPDVGDAVGRPALLDVLDGALCRRLTTVVAGPGYGKTTLLASWARRNPCAWYALTRGDGAVPVLARGLLDALRVRLPGLLDPMAWCGTELADLTGVDAVAAAVAEELERGCDTDIVLVVEAEALELRAAASRDPAGQLPRMREAAGIWADLGNPIASARNTLARARMAGACEVETIAAEQHLRTLGVRDQAAPVAGLLSAVSGPVRADVQVRTLGGFDLLRGCRAVRVTEWNSKKARDLLKLLISRRGRPTQREVLIETLWPTEDPARCANRLSVALSTVRAVLDPERRHAPDHFVHTDRHVVRLANLRIDVEELLAAAVRVVGRPAGRQVLVELQSVEARYTGDFLEEDPYEDWTVSLREQAKAAYLAVARTLAQAAANSGDEDLAVRLHLRMLERDPYDEDAHLGLTAVLVAAGRHGQARARYRTYPQRVAELGIEPAPFPAPPRRPLTAVQHADPEPTPRCG